MKRIIAAVLLSAVIFAGFLIGVLHHNHPLVFVIGNILFMAIGVVLTTFVVVYSQRPWSKSAIGKGIMFSQLSLAAITYLSITNIILGPDWEWRPFIRAALFIPILISQIYMLRLLFKNESPDRTEVSDGGTG